MVKVALHSGHPAVEIEWSAEAHEFLELFQPEPFDGLEEKLVAD
jgi:hypothetical protein